MSEVSAEATGETVGEAKWAALRELERRVPGLDKAAVRFEVLSEGERGLLGVGYAPARVVAYAEGEALEAPPAEAGGEPVEGESETAAVAREVVARIAGEIGARCSISVRETDEEVVVACAGDDLGMLIGRHGQTIDAVQYLANAIAWRRVGESRKPIVVDAAGYRDRRRRTLDAIAVRAAEQASASGREVALEPMTAVERKVVHERLKDDPEVETASEGTEPNRYVVIRPRRVAV